MIRSAPQTQSCIIVIFGAGGDLTKRKLVPALYNLERDGLLPERFALIGNARENVDTNEFRKRMRAALEQHLHSPPDPEIADRLINSFHYLPGDSKSPDVYTSLKRLSEEIQSSGGIEGNMIFYLATPPELFSIIPMQLAKAEMLSEADGHYRRVILEKPFGRDYDSAHELNQELAKVIKETQTFRIDHYLGKETVQNILAFRFANNIFEPLWNQHYIDSVQITVAEDEGIDGRGGYYDTAGALRDMVPNHLFQLVSLIGMEPPNSWDADDVRDEKLKVIQAIRPFTPEDAIRNVVRGQYGPPRRGTPDGQRGYRQEPRVSPDSETETFLAMRLAVDNWRWAGVPFYLRTGKRLADHETHIAIQFRHVPIQMFREVMTGLIEPNLLTIEIYPREQISLGIAAKIPGTVVRLGGVSMTFDYENAFGDLPKTGYETLIYDTMMGDRTLFQRGDQIEAAWNIVTPILKTWETCQCQSFPNYPSGSWGPPEAQALLARDGRYWRELETTPAPQPARRKAA